uniref:hypothetical protein n=1 Tax=Gracilaria cliftonii TaxID=206548 RepID=UPI001D0F8EBE|nr:hypothetical protein LKZ11_pgp119 [Gracilaria cliftonii]UAD84564.1 hypothetical protein [Gracilaria cliftonii]
MNLVQNFLLDRYIHSPKTWLHKLKSWYKIYFLFIYLHVVSYTHEKYITVSICLYFMFFLYFKNINNNYKKFLYIMSILIYIIIILIESSFNIWIIKLSYIYYFIIYIFSKYILQLRTLLILIHYFFTINTIFLTTTYENIIFCFFQLLKQNKSNSINKIIFISTFASQALGGITTKIRYMLFSIKIKKITKLYKFKYYIYIYLISKFIQDIYSDIYIISTVLYTREVNNNLIYITCIYE